MGILDKLLGRRSPDDEKDPSVSPAGELPERRYDNVKVVSMADGTAITGHDAVKAHFEKEDELLREHGASILFHIYRLNLQATSFAELNGDRLAEIKVDGGFVSGDDTVAAVKAKLPLLIAAARPDLALTADDRLTLHFNGRPMRDDKLFYADHFMLLPVWVQVSVHACEVEQIVALASRLARNQETS